MGDGNPEAYKVQVQSWHGWVTVLRTPSLPAANRDVETRAKFAMIVLPMRVVPVVGEA